MNTEILIIEDDPVIRKELQTVLDPAVVAYDPAASIGIRKPGDDMA